MKAVSVLFTSSIFSVDFLGASSIIEEKDLEIDYYDGGSVDFSLWLYKVFSQGAVSIN